MRSWIQLGTLALTFYAGTLAFCQPAAQAPVTQGGLQKTFQWQGTDFSKVAPSWDATSLSSLPLIASRDAVPPRGSVGALTGHIDSGIIHQPPKASLGVQPQGTLVAQNEYPGLEFLPIEIPKRKLHPISVTWPNFKIEPIPTDSLNAQPLPITGGASSTKTGLVR